MHTSFWFLIVLILINLGLIIKKESEDTKDNELYIPLTAIVAILTIVSVCFLFVFRRTKGDMPYIHKRVILNIVTLILYFSSLMILDKKSNKDEDIKLYILTSWIVASIIFVSLMTNSLVFKSP